MISVKESNVKYFNSLEEAVRTQAKLQNSNNNFFKDTANILKFDEHTKEDHTSIFDELFSDKIKSVSEYSVSPVGCYGSLAVAVYTLQTVKNAVIKENSNDAPRLVESFIDDVFSQQTEQCYNDSDYREYVIGLVRALMHSFLKKENDNFENTYTI